MNTQPEALRLVQRLAHVCKYSDSEHWDPEAMRQVWIGPWVGHGPCPNGDFVEVKDEL